MTTEEAEAVGIRVVAVDGGYVVVLDVDDHARAALAQAITLIPTARTIMIDACGFVNADSDRALAAAYLDHRCTEGGDSPRLYLK